MNIDQILDDLSQTFAVRRPTWEQRGTALPRLNVSALSEPSNAQATKSSVSLTHSNAQVTTASMYLTERNHIILGADANHHTLLHEFAHALADATQMTYEAHGVSFYDALKRVASHYFGGFPQQYAWATEYADLREWAVRDGLLDAERNE